MTTPLDHVAVGQPHSDAHNAERDRINSLVDSVTDLEASVDGLQTSVTTAQNAATTAQTSATGAQTSSTTNLQRIRQDIDARWRAPMNAEATVNSSTTADTTLTKTFSFSVAGQANATNRRITQAELDAFPVDFGQPASYPDCYCSSSVGYFWNVGTNDKVTTPPVTNAFRLMPTEARFRTNATKVSISLYRLQGPTADGHQVFVDGIPVTLRPQLGSNTVDYVTISFSDSKTREISFCTTAGIGPISVGPNYDIWRPEPRTGPIFYVTGDSYSDPIVFGDSGAAAAAGLFLEGLGFGIGFGCGAADHYVDGIGGTGFIKTTTGTESVGGTVSNNYEARLPQLVAAATAAWNNNQQDFVWIIPNGAVNDVANYGTVVNGVTISQQTVIDAFRRMAIALRAAHPKARIIWGHGFTPPYTGFAGAAASYTALRQALQTQCADLGVYYIDTTDWIKGTGYLGSTLPLTIGITTGSNIFTGTGFISSTVGAPISGTGIPAGTYIVSVTDSTHAVMSQNATATNAALSATLGSTRMDGNSSVYVGSDRTHLIGLGYRYLRQRYLPKLRRILIDTGALLNQAL